MSTKQQDADQLVNCDHCKQHEFLPVNLHQISAIKLGINVKHDLSEDQLNLIKSGVCDSCWDKQAEVA